jgi:16S rRNA (guanine1516-N2)-methyltransferase
MHLIETDAITWLRQCPESEHPDVVYLDPMYPHRTKSALVKKEMRLLRALVGDDEDTGELLQAALGCAIKRVVVKRPKGAPPVMPTQTNSLRPSAAVESKNTRYDIYPVMLRDKD